jgi:hypothetical protein
MLVSSFAVAGPFLFVLGHDIRVFGGNNGEHTIVTGNRKADWR